MRTAGKQKAGFYPTPLSVVELIRTYIKRPIFEEKYRVFDPCCGEGEALKVLASQLGIKETYGVELDRKRTSEARKSLRKVLCGSYESLRSTWKSFSLLFLNPPYDYDEEAKRLEYKFLVKLTPYLQEGGLLVYVIVKKHLNKETARFLSAHYENIRVMRFPDGEYEAFNQIVIFATRKSVVYQDPYLRGELEKVPSYDKQKIPELKGLREPIYELAAVGSENTFYLNSVDCKQALEEIKTTGLFKKGAVVDLIFPRKLPELKPLMPLRKGHLVMLISAGYLNNTLLTYRGRKLLIKGRCVKEQIKRTKEDEKGVTVSERDVIKTTIKGLFLDSGEVVTIK